ncbi:MAG TPA: hypothetical protein PK323_04235 [Bacteroidia bacterium]|nr:hypothetical protein [Bacteroidia bacterium]
MKNKILSYLALGLFLLLCQPIKAQFYYGTQMDFGKNRIQFAPYKWEYFRFEKFDTYFYKNGRELAAYVSESAIKNLKEIEEFYDYQLDSRIQFVVYNKLSDFRLSNIGLSTDPTFNLGGSNKLAGSKIIIYNDGNHVELEKQIRAGLAEMLFNQMLYGGNWKEVIKNSALLSLPEWYTKGLFAYIASNWNAHIENIVKDAIPNNKFKNINRLSGKDAEYAGHAVWRYIAESYGTAVIPNIIYMTKISHNIESGFSFVLGVTLKTLDQDWKNYYNKKFAENPSIDPIPFYHEAVIKKTKKSRQYSQFKISPDGKYAAFVTNEMGQLKLFVYDMEHKKLRRIYKAEKKLERINDYSYPVIAWHPSSKLLTYIYEKKGEVNLNYFNIENKKIEKRPPLYNFEKILDFSYADDGKTLVLSAVQKGQTDIFVYNLTSNFTEQITKDLYDDLNPRFINGGRQIIFASNRIDDTIRIDGKTLYQKLGKKNDLFLYDYKNKSKLLRRVTSTPEIDESAPFSYNKNYITYLGEKDFVTQRFVAKFDSAVSFVDTTEHYRYFAISKQIGLNSRSILMQDVNSISNKVSEIFLYKGRYKLLSTELKPFDEISLAKDINKTSNSTEKKAEEKKEEPVAPPSSVKIVESIKIPDNRLQPDYQKNGSIDINNFEFENEKRDTVKSVQKKQPDTLSIRNFEAAKIGNGITETPFVLPKQRNYLRTYSIDQLVTQFDNTFLNNGYQQFTGSAVLFNPGVNGLIKIGASDVFEDHRIVGGFKLGFDLKSNEVFLSTENRAGRFDKQWLFYRQSFPNTDAFGAPKQLSHQIRYSVKYPFNELASLRGSITGRNDKSTFLATDINNLQKPAVFEYWGIGKLEFVYDNTRAKGVNVLFGTRYKIFAEYFNRIDVTSKNITVIGLDYRHYTKIHRNLVWANRFAASTSGGTQKLVYYLGSVDNWINFSSSPTFNPEVPVAKDQNYAYQALASNLRGFSQNIRNGNSFAVFNSEIRWPMFSYLLNRPIKNEFINTFQLIAFGDIGTAWTGKSPYAKNNSFNIQTITQNPITVTIQREQEPLVGGYGWGMRSKILGYFVRADWAWGIDDGEVKPRIFYLSLALDF